MTENTGLPDARSRAREVREVRELYEMLEQRLFNKAAAPRTAG
jgi:hypothetical protein